MKKHIQFIFLFALLSCNSRQPVATEIPANADSASQHRISPFGTNEELYIVNYIGKDTIDPVGNACKLVEMKNSVDSFFYSCFLKNDQVKIGDSIWIGISTTNEKYIIRNH